MDFIKKKTVSYDVDNYNTTKDWILIEKENEIDFCAISKNKYRMDEMVFDTELNVEKEIRKKCEKRAEKRCISLGIIKSQELVEVRGTLRKFYTARLDNVERYERNSVWNKWQSGSSIGSSIGTSIDASQSQLPKTTKRNKKDTRDYDYDEIMKQI